MLHKFKVYDIMIWLTYIMKSESVSHSVVSWHCNPMNCSVHGILQARTLEWVVISSPGNHPNPATEPKFSALKADYLPSEPPGKPYEMVITIVWWTSVISCRHFIEKKKVFLFVMRILRIYSLNRLPLQCTAVLLTITLPYCTLHP